MSESHDVVIVGAGPAGSASAYFLASRGFDVQLLDKAEFPRDKTCGDALSPRSLHVLRTMGLLEAILAAGHRLDHVLLYAPNGQPVQAHVPNFAGLPDFVVVLPRLKLDELVRRQAAQAGAQFRARVTVTDLIWDQARVVGVRAESPAGPIELRARLTLLATGAATALLERAGLLPRQPAFGRAARTYFENMPATANAVEFHFDAVPLPGYGWVFPTSPTSANVGAGYFTRAGRPALRNSPRQVFDDFVASPRLRALLAKARQTAPVKGYPLRFDFPTARTALPGLRLVGEACGLVNPLTGEGIDYALESAEVAAEAVSGALQTDSDPERAARQYAQALRARFLGTFVNISRVRDLYLRPWVLNRFAAAAMKSEELRLLLINTALGNIDPLRALSAGTLVRIAIG